MNNMTDQKRADIIILAVMALALPLLIVLHLLPALLMGLLVHELVHMLAPRLFGGRNLGRAKIVALALLLFVIVVTIGAAIAGIIVFLHSDAGSLSALLEKLAEVLERIRETFPAFLQQWLPAQGTDLEQQLVAWLRTHAQELQTAGGAFGRVLLTSFIGMVIGGLVSLQEAESPTQRRFLSRAFAECGARLADAFRRIVFAQVRISALNTLLTSVYLVVLLPLLGISLPLIKTMLLVTFLVGLIPVLGNLISNTVIVLISLSYSLPAAIGSLIFLIVIHKLEYFINAKIVGAQIKASAFELLSVMLIMDAIFGVPGIVAAPIFYAYFKSEFSHHRWI